MTACPSITSTPRSSQRALRIGREIVGKARQHARAGLDQDDARLVGVDVAEVGRQRVARQFGDGAGEFDAGRSGADDDKGQAVRRASPDRSRARRVRTQPGYAAAAWWRLRAFSVRARTAPIRRGRNRRDARRWRAPAYRKASVSPSSSSTRLLAASTPLTVGEQGRDVAAVAQEIADRPGDFGGGERSGRDLIQQRLKQMMVAAVDQRDLDRRALQPQRAFQPAEAGADDHHAMGGFRIEALAAVMAAPGFETAPTLWCKRLCVCAQGRIFDRRSQS